MYMGKAVVPMGVCYGFLMKYLLDFAGEASGSGAPEQSGSNRSGKGSGIRLKRSLGSKETFIFTNIIRFLTRIAWD